MLSFFLLELFLPTFGTHLHLCYKTGAASTYLWHPLTFHIHITIHITFGTHLRLYLELLLPTKLISLFLESSSYWSCFYLLSAPTYIFSTRPELLQPTCGTLLRFIFMLQCTIHSALTYDFTWSCYYLLSLCPCFLNLYFTSSAFLSIQL